MNSLILVNISMGCNICNYFATEARELLWNDTLEQEIYRSYRAKVIVFEMSPFESCKNDL